MTQDIIEAKLDRRRKVSLARARVERPLYLWMISTCPRLRSGAQPPLDLRNFRQELDDGRLVRLGRDDVEDHDCGLLAAMGPPGGGRNALTPRFLRHLA